MVINCTAGMECKWQTFEAVVAAAERYLGVPVVVSLLVKSNHVKAVGLR
jgi:hypothetical protein